VKGRRGGNVPADARYVAAKDRELGRKPLARRFLNENVVLDRTEAGAPVVAEYS